MTRVNIILAQSYMQRKPWVSDSLMLVCFFWFLSTKLEVWNLGSSIHSLLLTPTPQNFFRKHSQGIPGMLSTKFHPEMQTRPPHSQPIPWQAEPWYTQQRLENRNKQAASSFSVSPCTCGALWTCLCCYHTPGCKTQPQVSSWLSTR